MGPGRTLTSQYNLVSMGSLHLPVLSSITLTSPPKVLPTTAEVGIEHLHYGGNECGDLETQWLPNNLRRSSWFWPLPLLSQCMAPSVSGALEVSVI